MDHDILTLQDVKLYRLRFSDRAIVFINHKHSVSTSKRLRFSNVPTNCNTTKLWCRGPSREAIATILTVFHMNLPGIKPTAFKSQGGKVISNDLFDTYSDLL